MRKELKLEGKENYPFNLLTNTEETIRALTDIEGDAWLSMQKLSVKRGDMEYTFQGALDKLAKTEQEKEELKDKVIYTIYGNGGVTRWFVMGNGDIRFSEFHDPLKNKIEKVRAMGFKVF